VNLIERDFDIDEFLTRPLFAHVASIGGDGPCESPVWFLWEDGAVWMIADSQASLPKRLAADPRCAIGIVDFDLERGFLQHLGMRGAATVQATNADRLERFLARYIGPKTSWNPRFKEQVIDRQDVMVRFVPETVVARDQSYFRGDATRADLES